MSTTMPCKGVTKLVFFGQGTSHYWSGAQRAKGIHAVSQLRASLAWALSLQITKADWIALGKPSAHRTSRSTTSSIMCSADTAKDHFAKRIPSLRALLLKIRKPYNCQPNKYFQRIKESFILILMPHWLSCSITAVQHPSIAEASSQPHQSAWFTSYTRTFPLQFIWKRHSPMWVFGESYLSEQQHLKGQCWVYGSSTPSPAFWAMCTSSAPFIPDPVTSSMRKPLAGHLEKEDLYWEVSSPSHCCVLMQ